MSSTLDRLRARYSQLINERQGNRERMEEARAQLRSMEESEIGYAYVLCELERQIKAEEAPAPAYSDEGAPVAAQAPTLNRLAGLQTRKKATGSRRRG